jgi:hypothetical protein
MAVSEDEQTQENGNGGGGHGALKAAAAAAATGAATLAVRKVISSHGSSQSRSSRDEGDDRDDRDDEEGDDGDRGRVERRSSSKPTSMLASAGASAWEAASGALLPLAEEAAEAAGRYLAESAPDVVRERIVPRFIKAFNDAD